MHKLLRWGLVAAFALTGCTASRTVIVHERTAPPPPAAAKPSVWDHPSQIHTRNGIRFYERGHYRKAIQQFGQAIDKDPSNWEAHFYMAECYRELRDWDRCLVHYHRARDMCDDDPVWVAKVQFSIGLVHERRGHLVKAREYYELALVAVPDFEPARRAKLRLASKKFKSHGDDEPDGDNNDNHRGDGKKYDD